MKKLILLSIILIFLGCEQASEIITDPNTVSMIEDTAEAGVTLTQLLGAFWPALIPVGTLAGGVLATYKRLKPKIKEAQAETNKYYAGGETLAAILDDFKINYPDLWEKIGPKIAKASNKSKDVSDAIKGFRGI